MPTTPTTTPTTGKLQVFFDGACPVCSREARRYQTRDRFHHIEWVDIAQPGFDAHHYGLDPARIQQVMHARTPDGAIHTQVAAFVKIWEALPAAPLTTPLRLLLKIPGMMAIAGVFYRLFARNRYRLTGRCSPATCDTPTNSRR